MARVGIEWGRGKKLIVNKHFERIITIKLNNCTCLFLVSLAISAGQERLDEYSRGDVE